MNSTKMKTKVEWSWKCCVWNIYKYLEAANSKYLEDNTVLMNNFIVIIGNYLHESQDAKSA